MSNDAIWIVDDDTEDHDLIMEVCKDLKTPHPVEFFKGSAEMMDRLNEVKYAPFIIICDVNLRGIDGFQLREKMLETPDRKFHSVPFIFWSTTASDAQIDKAYKLRAHGFFIKEPKYKEWKETFMGIINYWAKSKMPSKKESAEQPLK